MIEKITMMRDVVTRVGRSHLAKKVVAGLLSAAVVAGASAANQAPTVSFTSPLAGASFVTPSTIPLSASPADSDGTISSVSFYNGTTLLGTVKTAPFNYDWNNVAAGVYSITSRATDNGGEVGISAPLSVIVKENVLPSVRLTSPVANASFIGPATVALSTSASDTDGTIRRVDYYRDAIFIGSATSAPYAFNWYNVIPGTYSLTAKATDDKWGASTSSPVNVVVKTNMPPSVVWTYPANASTLYTPGAITFAASAGDGDGFVARVEFYNGAVLIGSDTTQPFSYTWINPAPGTYSLTARAIDSKGAASATSPVAVTVKAAPVPVVTITSPQQNARFIAPAKFNVMASASVTGDEIAKVEYFSSGVLIGTATVAPFAIAISNVGAGNYNVSARAIGKLGGTATSTNVDLTVVQNLAPAVSLNTSLSSNVSPADVSMTATATDPDGTVARVEFYNGANLLTTITQPPYIYTLKGLNAGTYPITARATDDNNSVASSNVSTITVNAPVSDTTEIFYIETDQIETAREIRNGEGAIVWVAGEDAFGTYLPNEIPSGKGRFTYNQRFPGQYFDGETGLHYNHYRDFDPQTGRYVQSDPIGLWGGVNTYAYVSSNPLAEIDPLGLFGWRDAAGFVPVLGSGLDAYDAYQCGNYAMAGLNTALAAADLTGVGALVKGMTVGTMRYSARRSIQGAYATSKNWTGMRRRLQRIGEVDINNWATPKRDWSTTDHVFFKQRDNFPHWLTNHPANLQTDVSQSLNSRFEFMTPLDRMLHLPNWMKLSAGGSASYVGGLFVGPGDGCKCAEW